MNRDLTVGSPQKILWRFCLPLFGSIVFQQIYNITDSFVAGRYIGENALAAVGNAYQLTLLFIAFAFGCNVGCSVIVSRFFGARQYEKMKTAVYTTWIAGAAICVILMATGLLTGDALLKVIRTPDTLFSDSSMYLKIYIWGFPFLLFYNVATGIFSALGDSRTPFIFLAASSMANIFMDICFVKYMNMGVMGVAWATFICQGISCLLAVAVVIKRLTKVKCENRPKLFSGTILIMIAKIAVPSILQQSFISVGNVIIQGTINDYGEGVMAGYSTAVKLNNLVVSAFTALGNGVSNYVSQNIGAGKTERLKPGFFAGLRLVWIICVPVMILYLTTSEMLVKVFVDNPSQLAIETGVLFLVIVVPFYPVAVAKLISDGVLRGAGKMQQFMTGTFTDLILRVVLSFILSSLLGSVGIWLAWPIGWVIACAISLFFCSRVLKKKDENT